MFRFNDDVRPHVERIVSVMQWANSNQYADQRGVYGMMSNALNLIVSRECGADVLEAIENSRNHWNFGGNESWLVDVEVAVENALVALDLLLEIRDTRSALDFQNNSPDCEPGQEAEYAWELFAELKSLYHALSEVR